MQSKKCISCRRTLPISYYGIRRASKDGYHSKCKECAQYYEKAHYRRYAPKGADVHDIPLICTPLTKHNTEFIISNLPTNKKHAKQFYGTSLSDGTTYYILMAKRDQAYEFDLRENEGLKEIDKYWTTRDTFVETMAKILTDLEIRLHHTEECDILQFTD